MGASELTTVAAALQKQATRDFGPNLGASKPCRAFAKLEDVPTDYWPVILKMISKPGALECMRTRMGSFALVSSAMSVSDGKPMKPSKMLGDPWKPPGRRAVAKTRQGRVNFLVESVTLPKTAIGLHGEWGDVSDF